MPLFDFVCHECGAEVEMLVKDSEVKPECDACGATLERVREVEDARFSKSSLKRFCYGLPGRPLG